MKQFRYKLPLLECLLMLCALFSYASMHGGYRGDIAIMHAGDPEQPIVFGLRNPILLNLWVLELHRPSFLLFMFWLNAPAFLCAKGIVLVWAGLDSHFEYSFPYGISYSSYIFLIAQPLCLGQWFAIGWIFDTWRNHSAGGPIKGREGVR
jgi:hypothetical protein